MHRLRPVSLLIGACFAIVLTMPGAASADGKPANRAGLDWWSLQPIRRPAVPAPKDVAWRGNPIDAFIKARLEQEGIEPSLEIGPRAFIRRVTLDLTGLLPTPEEVEAFVKESAANPQTAREKLVDRLLASTAYGERWGRHWLDVMRFAESHGYEMNTLRPNAWPYRDYVIRAFNRDTPFAQFVAEQLAGDALPDADSLSQSATGFLVGGPHDLVGDQTLEGTLQQRSNDLFDMVSTTGSAFLGLTVGCARCHDHKFDPIPQTDFYRMQAVFAGVEHAERPIASGTEGTRRAEVAKLREELRELETKLDALVPLAGQEETKPAKLRESVNPRRNVERFPVIEARSVRMSIVATNDGTQPCIDELEIYGPDDPAKNLALAGTSSASSEYPNAAIHKIAHLNDGRHGNGRSWISNEPGRGWARIELPQPARIDRVVWGRDREGQYKDRLAATYRIEVSADGKTWQNVAGSWDRRPVGAPAADESDGASKELLTRREAILKAVAEKEKEPLVYAGRFKRPEPSHVLNRGDVMKKGDEVGPAALTGIGRPWSLPNDAPDKERRLGLARWIVDPANPLPARVLANRVWHYHFGQGIVRTPSDFGFNGDRPSHPELLDYLAFTFREEGGRLKPLHRLIVLSNTYRQSSRIDPAKSKRDAGNRLLWHFPGRRLEAEAVRDIVLQTSGALDRRAGGPGYHLWTYSGYVIVFTPKPKLGPDEFRRMVYQFKPRLQQDGTFGVFDCPDGTGVAPKRLASTTPLQALNLLNDEFIHDQADRFAARLRKEAGEKPADQVRRAFLLVFGREPTPAEAAAAVKLIEQHGAATLSRALFNANEFLRLE
jgi:hypothetical protein